MAQKGQLRIQCFDGESYLPLDNCKITVTPISDRKKVSKKNMRTVDLVTDSSGSTITIDLDAPPLENSQNPNGKSPYSTCDIKVERDGFMPFVVKGCQIYPDEIAYQKCELEATGNRADRTDIVIVQPNRLFGDFPRKIPESVEKQLPEATSGVVLPKPVAPEYIVVHEGSPKNSLAKNYTVLYKDYIKNVASSEIYSTWPESTIRANIFCIISFTLNRIYTEWYRSKRKNFQITNSTAYDHAFNYGRNIYENISNIVDEIFATYIRRIGRKQPLLTQYCDGKNVSCPQWLSQWGSKYLGDQGKTPYEILTYYYGSDIELVTAEKVNGIPYSYPGYDLTVGSRGEPVKVIQRYLNRIAKNYPLIPKVAVDGILGPKSSEQIRVFQGVFGLYKTGIVDYRTWYKVSEIYVGVTKIAELK